jgi:hypothetical protein
MENTVLVDSEILLSQQQFTREIEEKRNLNQIALEAKRAKLETIRLAKEVLMENARSKPVDSREVTATDITAFAAVLQAHINDA